MAYAILKYHGSFNVRPRTATVKYIVVHYTGSGSSAAPAALNNCQYFSRADRQSSAHYFIDDSTIYEYADPKASITWHCGDGAGQFGVTNQNSIGIEVCRSGDVPYTSEEIERLAWLVQKLMKDFGVPAERVVRHYDASRKACPYYYTPSGSGGNAAWKKLHATITATGSSKGGSTVAAKPVASAAKIDEDGIFGPKSVHALQVLLGTPADSKITGQWPANKKWLPALTAVTYDKGGSACVKALQKKLGVDSDGYLGPNTVKAMQRRWGLDVDGIFGHDTAQALQKAINKGKI